MTYKYGADFETAVLANANCGGENVARGARKEVQRKKVLDKGSKTSRRSYDQWPMTLAI